MHDVDLWKPGKSALILSETDLPLGMYRGLFGEGLADTFSYLKLTYVTS